MTTHIQGIAPIFHDRIPALRLAYIVPDFDRGGLERCVGRLVNGLDHRRFAPPVVISLTGIGSAAGWILRANTPLIALEKKSGNNPSVVWRLTRLLRRLHIDVVHSHNWGTLLETVVARRWASVPVHVHSERGTVLDNPGGKGWRHRLRAHAARWGLQRADAVLAVSHATSDELAKACSFPAERIQVVSNGVEPPLVANPIAARDEVRATLQLEESTTLVGAVGRLHRVKDIHTLIAAVRLATQQGCDLALLVVGEGPERQRLEQDAATCGFANRVRFVGASDCVGHWLAALDLFVNSSISEGMSQAVLEAMSLEIPLIVTDVGDHARVVAGTSTIGPCGLAVRPGSPEDLAEAIVHLVRQPDLRYQWGRNGARRHRSEYTVSVMLERYERLYTSLATVMRITTPRHQTRGARLVEGGPQSAKTANLDPPPV